MMRRSLSFGVWRRLKEVVFAAARAPAKPKPRASKAAKTPALSAPAPAALALAAVRTIIGVDPDVGGAIAVSAGVTLRARWVTLRARWVTLRARWVTLRARWVTLRARWVTLRARWVTLRARWVTLRCYGGKEAPVHSRCARGGLVSSLGSTRGCVRCTAHPPYRYQQ
jgi:hypothetical protein